MGMLPSLQSATLAAAVRFEDRTGYARCVLDGVPLVARAAFGGKPFDAVDGIIAILAGIGLALGYLLWAAWAASIGCNRVAFTNGAGSSQRSCRGLRDMVDVWSGRVRRAWNPVFTIVMQHHGFARRRWNETTDSCAHLPDMPAIPGRVTPGSP